MDIILSGLVGYEAALKLYEDNKEFLDARFPGFYVERFLQLGEAEGLKAATGKEAVVGKEAAAEKEAAGHDIAKPNGAVDIKEGGVFAALWQLCEEEHCGCEVDIKKIPIKQEVIEICELFDVNPYEAASNGAWVSVKDSGHVPRKQDENAAQVIGKTTKDKARIVLMGTDDKTGERLKRFLTPPERQKKDLANASRK